ncbi:exodeoxyribonuclease V subunit gamma [Desulfurivibrio dismutans]|uniref:exodeoxyribonuclease V subunit gamma n=1 Tax=Desulfurivibrio dismutans TaxID=1398908 RepID=UPI0023DC8741|nr:exodeoxyribonuclease V subunit gamma [Desulfurivibrio alkaliphilus]MDF1614982.1 exodeoxyribonuclease V subunit gamma [Desulfurivibrio alkaliphilus]
MPVERRLILYRSNRLEALLECLADGLRHDPPPPLTSECLVVQSRGMATWLGQNLARRFGVWAHPDFPHPRRFIERLLNAALGAEAGTAASFSRERLTLAILELLPRLLDQEEFTPLRRYLEGGDDWKSLQLAERIAYVFDQYLVYRPDMVLAWEDRRVEPEPENRWQALLWRQLADRFGSPARLFQQAHARLRQGDLLQPELLPPRVFLFGITTLPPLYLGLLNDAAKLLPCHLLLFSPARDYWADIFSPQALNRLLLKHQPAANNPGEQTGEQTEALTEQLHLATGHPLLASLGFVGREFQEILESQAEYVQPEAGECFADPVAAELAPPAATGGPEDGEGAVSSMLARLQRDILELRHPTPETAVEIPAATESATLPSTSPAMAPIDDSIVIHSCHSPLREVEVLQDQLLAMLAEEGYRPRDIVIMVPDIETYAPLIEAVFRRPATDRRYIPFRLADRKISREAPLLDALLTLFELARGRLPLSQVLDFLAREPVKQGFSLDGQQLQRIEQWLNQLRVRWGIDEEHRRRHDQPPTRQNTWRFGLDRLILGYALPGEDRHLVAGILPFDDIEGQDAILAGVLLKITAALFALVEEVRRAKTMVQWVELVRRALADFFLPEERAAAEEEWQRQSLRDALAALLQDSEQAGLERPLELPAFLRLLRTRLDEAGGSAGFLEGGLTFCNMLPMRTIPFPVVCLLGLSDGAYPRRDQPAGFDLMAAAPRPGDRSRRRDDRYLFLESLLSARRRLYLSYVGRSSKDNAELPPSPLVEELLDCLALMSGAPRNYLVTEHPLQPFSPRYFQPAPAPLFTYAAEYAPPANVQPQPSSGRPDRPIHVTDNSDSAETAIHELTLAELHHFFRNPARWYARNRLGLILPPEEEEQPDREPVFFSNLEKYLLNRQLLHTPAEMPSADPANEAGQRRRQMLAARGELPLAGAAGPALAELVSDIEPVAAYLATSPAGRPLPNLPLELTLEPEPGLKLRLGGELRDRAENGLLRWTPARVKPVFLLLAWLDHLALCAQAPSDQDRQCFVVGRGEKKDGPKAAIRLFQALDRASALALLAQLAALWRRGQVEPLPFFPASSHAWCWKRQNSKSNDLQKNRQQAREAALNSYHGTDFNRGEGLDPYMAMIFQEAQPAGPWQEQGDQGPAGTDWEDFAAVAETVYGPLLQAMLKKSAEAA